METAIKKYLIAFLLLATSCDSHALLFFGMPACAKEKVIKIGDDDWRYSDPDGFEISSCSVLFNDPPIVSQKSDDGVDALTAYEEEKGILLYGLSTEHWTDERFCAVRVLIEKCKKWAKKNGASIEYPRKNIEVAESIQADLKSGKPDVDIASIDKEREDSARGSDVSDNSIQSLELESGKKEDDDEISKRSQTHKSEKISLPKATAQNLENSHANNKASSKCSSLSKECAVANRLSIGFLITLVWMIVAVILHKNRVVTIFCSYTDAAITLTYFPVILILYMSMSRDNLPVAAAIVSAIFLGYSAYLSWATNRNPAKALYVLITRAALMMFLLAVMAILLAAISALAPFLAIFLPQRRRGEWRKRHAARQWAFFAAIGVAITALFTAVVVGIVNLLTREHEFISLAESLQVGAASGAD